MKYSSKAVHCTEEDDLESLIEETKISMKYDKLEGLIVTFPEGTTKEHYIAVGSELVSISFELNGKTYRYGSIIK